MTVKRLGQKAKATKSRSALPKKKREPIACKICGTMFTPKKEQHYTCGPECHKENQKRLHKVWYEKNSREYIQKVQAQYVYKPSGKCKICGEVINQPYTNSKRRSTKQVHDECVYKKCFEVLSSGGQLDTVNKQRLYARGYTIKEFMEEYGEGI